MNTLTISNKQQNVLKATPPTKAENGLPPLETGDHLTRAEFERRYLARPDVKKAELIEGVVYVSSPDYAKHAEVHSDVMGWLAAYRAATKGIRVADNATLRLDMDNEVQPDACVWIDPKQKVRVTQKGFLEGVPDFIVEVAVSSASYDLHDKLKIYRRNGVQEYLVLQVLEQETAWFTWQEGAYLLLEADETGILRSQVFPGLWLQPAHLWAGDLAGVLAVLQEGMKSAEYTDFAIRLQGSES